MKDVIESYELDGRLVCRSPFGSGHINETWLLVTNRPHLYILQKVNTETFPDPVGLMNNIIRVTDHIRGKEKDPRKVLPWCPPGTAGNIFWERIASCGGCLNL